MADESAYRVGDGERRAVDARLQRAHAAAERLGGGEYLIRVEGLRFVVRNATVVTVLFDEGPVSGAATLSRRRV